MNSSKIRSARQSPATDYTKLRTALPCLATDAGKTDNL